MLHINPAYGGMTSRIIPMDVDKHQVTNQVGRRNDACPTVQMQFKLAADKNLGSDNQGLDKLRVGMSSENPKVPSTSFAFPGTPNKNVTSSRQSGPTDALRLSSSSSWIPVLQRNASAK
ncbi:unnamed protein product [Musa acuminata subsp. burmannicoides]